MRNFYEIIKTGLLLVIIWNVITFQLFAQEKVLLGWTTNQITGTTETLTSTTTDIAVENGILGRGPDTDVLASGSFSGYFQTLLKLVDAANAPSNSQVNTKSEAVFKGAYIEFTVRPKAGQKISLTKLKYKLRPGSNSSGGSQPIYYRWAYSTDNWENYCELEQYDGQLTYTSGGTEPNSNGIYLPDIVLNEETKLQDISTANGVIFRLYVWGARNSSNATIGIGKGSAGEEVLSLYGTSEELSTTPVDLVKFEAQRAGEGIKLSWITASEQNSSHFELIKSCNGNDFYPLASVSSQGSSSSPNLYSYIDNTPCRGVNYYKLIQIDINGTQKNYGQVSVEYDITKFQNIYAYHKLGKTYVNISSSIDQDGVLILADITGRLIYKDNVFVKTGDNKFEIDDSSNAFGVNVVTFKDSSCKFMR